MISLNLTSLDASPSSFCKHAGSFCWCILLVSVRASCCSRCCGVVSRARLSVARRSMLLGSTSMVAQGRIGPARPIRQAATANSGRRSASHAAEKSSSRTLGGGGEERTRWKGRQLPSISVAAHGASSRVRDLRLRWTKRFQLAGDGAAPLVRLAEWTRENEDEGRGNEGERRRRHRDFEPNANLTWSRLVLCTQKPFFLSRAADQPPPDIAACAPR